MQSGSVFMYYASAILATIGTILYHNFAKRIPSTIDPMVSIVGTYLLILLIGFIILPFSMEKGSLMQNIRQLSWVQVGIAVSVMMIELGFVMMYRSGWDLSLGNVVTSVVINLALLGIGVLLLGEQVSWINVAGVVLSIAGVAMISYH